MIDANTAAIEIIETDGSTVVSQTQLTDTYQIKLTKAPVAEVRVGINVDGKAEIVTGGRVFQSVYAVGDMIPSGSSVGDPIAGRYYAVFTAGDWSPVTITLQYNETLQGNDSPFREFAVQPHELRRIAGPLIIEGGEGLEPRTLTRAVALPDEVNDPIIVDDARTGRGGSRPAQRLQRYRRPTACRAR